MDSPQHIGFLSSIEPTRANAVAIQRLTLQDVTVGGFKNPKSIADPDDEAFLSSQLDKLEQHPERYSGFTLDHELVAYMKIGEWTIVDEAPFATGLRAAWLRIKRWLRLNPKTGQLGIFGLVVSDELNDATRRLALVGLLSEACRTHRDVAPGMKFVNIVLHDNDPLQEIARAQSFVPRGKRGEAVGAPGKLQQRFIRRLGAW